MNTKLQKRLLGLSIIGLCLAAGTQPAKAYDPTARFSLAGTLSGSMPALADVDDRIGLGNVYMARQNWVPIEKLSAQFGLGYDLRMEVTDTWVFSLGGGTAFRSTGVDFDEVIDVDPSANMLHARLGYRLPWRPTDSIRLIAGAGYVTTLSASLTATHEHRDVESGTLRIETLDMDFSGNGGLAFLEAEFVMTERFTLSLDAGYRYLNTSLDSYNWSISRLGDQGQGDSDDDGIENFEDLSDRSYLRYSFLAGEQLNSEGRLSELEPEPIDLDFSGPTATISLRVYLF